jgi:hypothetical protein
LARVPRRDQTAAAVASATAPHRNRTGSEPADRQVREVESRVLHHLDQQQAVLPHRHAVDLAHLLGGNGRDRRRPKLEEPMPRPSASLVHDLMVPHRVSGEARYPDSKCLLDAIDRASRWVSGILNPRGRARSAQGRFVNGQVAGVIRVSVPQPFALRFNRRSSKPSTFICLIHPFMCGKVIVR